MATVHEQNQKALQSIMKELSAARRTADKLQEKLDAANANVTKLSDKLAAAAIAYKNGTPINLEVDSDADGNADADGNVESA